MLPVYSMFRQDQSEEAGAATGDGPWEDSARFLVLTHCEKFWPWCVYHTSVVLKTASLSALRPYPNGAAA